MAREPGDLRPVGDGAMALKIVSPDILHKTEAGGVTLGVAPGELRQRGAALLDTVRARRPDAVLTGLLAMPMAPAGVELIVGIAEDPQYGPVIACGLGGTGVEAVADIAFRALPCTRLDALEMM